LLTNPTINLTECHILKTESPKAKQNNQKLNIMHADIPPQAGMDVDHSKLGNKISKRPWSKRICEEIYSLVLGRNRHEVNKFGLNFLTYQVPIQFNVFGSFMEDWICYYVKS